RRATSCGHIPGRVQHGGLCPRRPHGDGRRLNFDRSLARDPSPSAEAECAEHDDESGPDDPPAEAAPLGFALDAERVQITLEIGHWERKLKPVYGTIIATVSVGIGRCLWIHKQCGSL